MKNEMNDRANNEILRLLDDRVHDPVNDNDEFNHKPYAKILAKIFNPNSNNRYGICVALFGKWGQGKSSVVEMLKKEMEPKKVKIVVFNAWQARGDSVRRQLFLEVLSQINPSEATKMKQFAGLEVARELLQTEEDKKESTKRARRTFFLGLRDDRWLCWSFIALLVLVMIPAYNFLLFFLYKVKINLVSNITPTILAPAIFYLIKYVKETVVSKYTGLLGISEPISESQKLKYPEQFKELFVKYASIFSKEEDCELLVVVDDLDRCDPETVVEALASIRQLSGTQEYVPKEGDRYYSEEIEMKCRFLIPCDEKQVVYALEADGHDAGRNGGQYHDYKTQELLRKFFDVVIRMDSFIPEDMVSFAGKIVKKFDGMNDIDILLVKELIGAVAPKDPRQVKKLINAYIVFKERIVTREESKLLLQTGNLPNIDKTILLVIALQETVPNVYSALVNDASLFADIRTAQSVDSISREEINKSSQILQALEPVSEKTFRFLTKKGVPETLIQVSNGLEIYDAVISGNHQDFCVELAKCDNIEKVAEWLREYKNGLRNNIARFRHSFTCMLSLEEIPNPILSTIEYYISFSQLAGALEGQSSVLLLSKLYTSGRIKQGLKVFSSAVTKNFSEIKSDTLFESIELKTLLELTAIEPDFCNKALLGKLSPLLIGSEQTKNIQYLSALSKIIPTDYVANNPDLALLIATKSPWSIYNTINPEQNKGLHSGIIKAFIGNDDEDLSRLFDVLFDKEGPLGAVIDLNTSSQKGEREGILTLQKIAPRFTDETLQNIFIKLKPWFAPQSVPENFKFICNVFSTEWPRLSEEQIQQFAVLLTDHCIVANTPEWICDFVKGVDINSKEIKNSYRTFCNKVFSHLNQKYLTASTINPLVQTMLICIANNHWPLAEEADITFANAVKTKVNNESNWETWKNSLWTLAKHDPKQTKTAICERIEKNFLSQALIPFAVIEVYKKKLSRSLKNALRDYYCADPNVVNNAGFTSLFKDEQIEGLNEVIGMLVEYLDAGKTKLDEPRIAFISNHLKCVEETKMGLFERFILVHYLRDANLKNVFKGISLLKQVRNFSDEVTNLIKEILTEQAGNISAEQRSLAVEVFGEQFIDSASTEDSSENS